MVNRPGVHLYVDHQGFKELAEAISDQPYRNAVLKRVLNAMAAEVARRMKGRLAGRKKTGATVGSVAIDFMGDLVRAVMIHNIVGLFLDQGTRAHEIAARNARALMLPVRAGMGREVAAMGFEVSSPYGRSFGPRGSARLTGSIRHGQVTFVKSIHHPGQAPYPVINPAYTQSLPMLDFVLLKAGAEIVDRMARKGELVGV